MLMNQNKSKSSSPKADINLDDLNTLDSIDLDAGPLKPNVPHLLMLQVIYLVDQKIMNLLVLN